MRGKRERKKERERAGGRPSKHKKKNVHTFIIDGVLASSARRGEPEQMKEEEEKEEEEKKKRQTHIG